MSVAAHQEQKENENTGEREAGKEEKNSQPISERLRAALLRSFRKQHGEKMVCVRGVPGVTGIVGKANSHFDATQKG